MILGTPSRYFGIYVFRNGRWWFWSTIFYLLFFGYVYVNILILIYYSKYFSCVCCWKFNIKNRHFLSFWRNQRFQSNPWESLFWHASWIICRNTAIKCINSRFRGWLVCWNEYGWHAGSDYVKFHHWIKQSYSQAVETTEPSPAEAKPTNDPFDLSGLLSSSQPTPSSVTVDSTQNTYVALLAKNKEESFLCSRM